MSNLTVNETLTKGFKAVNERLNKLSAKENPTGNETVKRNLVYVSRSELLAQNGVTSFANNTDYSYTFPKAFGKKPYLTAQLDFSGRYIGYIHSVSETGFKFAASYALGIQGLFYEAEEID